MNRQEIEQKLASALQKRAEIQTEIYGLRAMLRRVVKFPVAPDPTPTTLVSPDYTPAYVPLAAEPVEQLRPGFLPDGSLTDEEKAKRMERRRQHAAEVNARLKAQP